MAVPKMDLEMEMLKLTLGLYNNLSIPRNVIQIFVDSITNFVNVTYQNYILEKLTVEFKEHHNILLDKVKEACDSSKTIFDKFQTEYKRFALYEEKGLLFMPKERKIGHKYVEEVNDKKLITKQFDLFGQYMPLKWSLKLLLEIPGTFQLLKNYMDELENEKNIYSNFIQGELWKQKYKSKNNELVVPLFVFQDDCELGNALGPHAGKNKVGAMYTSIPCFPSQFVTQLDNILLTGLTYANDRKLCKNEDFYKELISELNELRQKGLDILVGNKVYKIFFQLCLILGDNLGLNEILGFVESFNSGKPCRICKASIDEIKNLINEKDDLLRTKESYQQDCDENNPSETGINEECIFHKVFGFHVCDNIILDLMHDIFEGTASFTLLKIVNYFIFEKKLFSLEFLNQRIQKFNNEQIEVSNKIPLLKSGHITSKEKLKMTAAETMSFV
ncbi:uncharacterized protein LOC127285403 [Leptopilina boulardi]|uniref:uncharacterized protein LOC127285403 n=1 Tax=Leptopilina boulardi TaxID=63433 RepID=UPI0021F554BE|nr:uncharacterized protein LOC127285403 [Leptopilina boulardi]